MCVFRPTAVVGGDLRQAQIANHLHRQNAAVACFYLTENQDLDKSLHAPSLADLQQYEVVILPMPLSTDGLHLHAPFSAQKVALQQVFSSISPSAHVFAGSVTEDAKTLARELGISITDYLARQELAIANAAITAEAAIALAIQEMPRALLGAHILVAGYGRIGKALLQRLAPMGATLYCAARKWADLAEIRSRGVIPVPMESLSQTLGHQNLVFNTVPALLFDENRLSHLPKDALLMDLASKPGGVDFSAAGNLGRTVIWALSLPGKSSPVTAGEIILDTISHCLAERSVNP